MKLVKWMAVAALAAGTFHTVSAMDGVATIMGGDVQYQGAADVQWVNGTELLLKFTGEGSFVLPDPATVRTLAIGGGGGGGGVCTASSAMMGQHGGGGGGGAGGFVDVTNVLPAATYVVAVGAGGAGGTSRSNHSSSYYPGTSGGDTTLSTNDVAWIVAHGGGGGGGETDGLSGGGGGGGSQFRQSSTVGVACPGGAGTPGQGSAGGAGDLGLYGGGGGGAGGAGASASTLDPVGGDGRTSDITGEAVWYAGGGGGGFCDKSFTGLHEPVAGGKGGGGNGGYGRNVPATDATFYGGGGGGCGALANSATTSGGNGHPGVVYVRIVSLDRPVTTFPLWVGGVQVCETNQNDILGDGTASFVPSASGGTLVLSNATITATHQFEDEWSSGSNTATVFSGEGFDLTISLTGSNILQNADHPLIVDQGHGYGVRSQGNLAITGGGALVAWVEYDGAGIDTDGDLLVDGAVVTAHSAQDGFNVDGGLVISNAIVTVRGSHYAGISGGDGGIDIADSVVTVTGYDGIDAHGYMVTVSGASVVTAETTYDDEDERALAADPLVLRDGLAITEPAGGAFDGGAGCVLDPATGKAALRVVIGTPPPDPPVVSNVVARQRWPWNGLVDVDYEVGGDTNLLAGLEARISFAASDGRSWVASNFLAGAEPSAGPGFHRATWDTKADGATNVVAANVVATVALVRPASCGRLALDFGGLGVRTDAASYRATLYDNAGNPTKDPLTAAIGDAPPPDAVFDDVPSSTRKAVVEFLDEGGNVLCETAVEGDAFPRLPPGGEVVVPVLEGDDVTLRVAHAWPAETETADMRIVYDDGAEKRVFVEGAGFDAAAGSCEAVFRAAGGAASVKSVMLLRDGVPFEWLDYASPPASANGALELDVDGNEFANGAYADGTAMQVANPRHLDNVRNHLGGSFRQIQDIDFAGSCGITNAIAVDKSDDGTDIACTRCDLDATVRFYGGAENAYGWTPIGDGEASPFSGTYDGNGCRIAGLVGNAVDRRSSVCALFGWAIGTTAKPAIVTNVRIADDCSFAADLSAAPLVAEGGGHLEIAGCETAGDVYSAQYAAGVLAEAYRDSDLQLKVSECTVGARIHGQNVAGVMSWCSGGSASLYKCVFGEDGAAIGSWAVGGLVCHAGLNEADSFVIDECHSLGTLSIPSTHDENRTSSHGGFIGYWASEGSLTIDGQCEVKARFDFEGSADRIGGVIGYCSRCEGVSDDQLKNRMKNIFTAHVSVDSGCLVAFEDRQIGTYAGDPWLDAL